MKEVNQEPDYLQRLRNVRDNTYEYITDNNITQDTLLGETFTELLKLLENEIVGVNYIRQF